MLNGRLPAELVDAGALFAVAVTATAAPDANLYRAKRGGRDSVVT